MSIFQPFQKNQFLNGRSKFDRSGLSCYLEIRLFAKRTSVYKRNGTQYALARS